MRPLCGEHSLSSTPLAMPVQPLLSLYITCTQSKTSFKLNSFLCVPCPCVPEQFIWGWLQHWLYMESFVYSLLLTVVCKTHIHHIPRLKQVTQILFVSMCTITLTDVRKKRTWFQRGTQWDILCHGIKDSAFSPNLNPVSDPTEQSEPLPWEFPLILILTSGINTGHQTQIPTNPALSSFSTEKQQDCFHSPALLQSLLPAKSHKDFLQLISSLLLKQKSSLTQASSMLFLWFRTIYFRFVNMNVSTQ